MSDPAEADARMVDAEGKVATPFRLNVNGLPEADRLAARLAFVEIATRALQLTIQELGRVPEHQEIAHLRTACTRYVNEVIVPELRERGQASGK